MHYVMSDIHGDSEGFDRILSMIDLRKEDHLYVLGDVIDRGKDGLVLLNRIRTMSNCTLLLGNHELMMINALLHPNDHEYMYVWMKNEGGQTLETYEKALDWVRAEELDYIEKIPVQLYMTVDQKDYIFVHAAPVELYERLNWKYPDPRQYAVWGRLDLGTEMPEGKIVIHGHTPTIQFMEQGHGRIYHSDRRINIDCGAGFPEIGGQLGCLRLEDMTEFYSLDGVVPATEAKRWRRENGWKM